LLLVISNFSSKGFIEGRKGISDLVNQGISTARRTHASLYDWIVYKRGSKARERKGEERKHRLKLYTILRLRDGTLPLRNGNMRQYASTVTLPPPSEKACPQALYIRITPLRRSCLYAL